ncbi:restriction endonuclease [Mucilaginibacter antarcticus]|uniref:Restriction endonuclease n=1 Tax=Mucilaginibacter antarcticus TaxID=1855725 RepID=A0ABW5XLI8_9SPHI
MNEKVSSVDKGTKFEKSVEKVLNWMYSQYDSVSIKHNVLINGPDTNRQIDVLITVTIRDLVFNVAVECKDYKGRLPVGILDAFVSKLEDVSASKGIIIASNGFSSSSIAKARRKGITLYSLTDKIEFNDAALDVTIVIEEVIPFETELKISVMRDAAQNMKGETLITDPLIVNGYDVHETLKEAWKAQTLEYKLHTDFQEIQIPKIDPPYRVNYFINTKNDMIDTVEISDFNPRLKLKINYYTIPLKELVDLKVLEHIEGKKYEMFIDIDTITNSLPNAKPVNKRFVEEFGGSKFIINVRGPFNITSIGGEYTGRDFFDS